MKRVLLAATIVILVFAGVAFASPVRLSPVAQLNLGYSEGSDRAAISGTYAYAVAGNHFQVYDLSNPLAPARIYSGADGAGTDVVAFGRYAFTTGGYNLNIIDVRNPSAPVIVGTLPLHGGRMAISIHYLYILTGTDFYNPNNPQSLRVIDFSTPTAPVEVGSLALPGNPAGIAISGNYAFITVNSSLVVVDISNPAAPSLVTTVALGIPAYGIAVQGNYAYATTHGEYCDEFEGCFWTNGYVFVLDIANPACPKVISSTMTDRATEDIVVAGQYAYIVEQTTDYYGGHWEFLEMNISDPAAPQAVGYFLSNILNSSARGVALIGNYVFQPITTGALVFARPSEPLPICTP